MDSHKQSICQIFDSGVTIEVPFFQRAYVWTIEEWAKFLSDMADLCKEQKPYFLGAIILKKITEDGKMKSIVDGQQRLTTLLILLKILSLKDEEACIEYFVNFGDRIGKERVCKLKHSYYDREAFEKIFYLKELVDLSGDNRIIQAYEYFKSNVGLYDIDYYSLIKNIVFVAIEIEAKEDEQQIFETINSVGRKLTTGELLKNYIFKDSAIEKYKEIWVPAFEKDEATINYWDSIITAGRTRRSNTESFFHAFLQIKMQSKEYDVPTEEKNIFRKADSVFNNYKIFISKYVKDIIPFAKEIASYANIFKESFEVDFTRQHIPAEPCIERINFIIYSFDATTLIPYILYILKNAENEEKTKIFEFLETYIIRRAICKESNDDYSDLFNEQLIKNEVKTVEGLIKYIDSKGNTATLMPNDEMVTEAFHTSALSNTRAKAILYLLESKLRSKKHSTCLDKCSKYELEHLMPKNWEAHWATLPEGVTENDRNKALKTLGNLMIISDSLNSSISNADWTTKKNGTQKYKGLLKYASELEIWNGALNLPEWNENTIYARAEWLAQQACEVWFNDCSDEVSSPRNKQDETLFSLDGKNFMNKSRFVPYLVKNYLQKNPNLTFKQLQEMFPDTLLKSSFRRLGLLVKKVDMDASPKDIKDKQKWYYIKDSSYLLKSGDGIEFYVNNQWTKDTIKVVVEKAKLDGWNVITK